MQKIKKQLFCVGASALMLCSCMLAVQPKVFASAATSNLKTTNAMTKGVLAKELYDLANQPSNVGKESFLDVTSKTPNRNAIVWACNNDMLEGSSKLFFNANSSVTVQNVIHAFYQLAKTPAVFGNLSAFTDYRQCKEDENAFIWATQNQILSVADSNRLNVNKIVSTTDYQLLKEAFVTYNTAEYSDYLCLGDSVATGYDPRKDEQGETFDTTWQNVDYAYHSLLANALGANLTSRAAIGLRTSELRMILEYKEGDKEDVSDEFHIDPRHILFHKTVPDLHEEYVNAIKNCDILTLQIGLNDVYTAPFNQTRDSVDFSPLNDFIHNVTSTNILGALKSSPALLSLISSVIDGYVTRSNQYYDQLENNWGEIINMIREINPTVKIVVVGGSDTLPDTLTQILVNPITNQINRMNEFYKKQASVMGYVFVDMGDPDSFMNNFLRGQFDYPFDAHPTALGHEQITQRILSVLPDSAIK